MPYKTIDEYIADFPKDAQDVLKKVRMAVKKAAPAAKEGIGYQMPTLKLHGHLVYYGAFKKHLGFFPPVKDKELKKRVAAYAGPKGNLQFPYDQPIPYSLIALIVKARVKEDKALAAAKSASKRNRAKR